jgi:hypothetical protein
MQPIRSQLSETPNAEFRQRRLARISGILYLIVAVLGMFAPTVLDAVAAPGGAAATAANLRDSVGLFGLSLVSWVILLAADGGLAVTLYLLLEPVSRALSLVTAALRLLYVAIVGASLINLYDAFLSLNRPEPIVVTSAFDTFSSSFLFALVFFGFHLILLGLLLYRSQYVPRVLSLALMAGGAGYVVHSLTSSLAADSALAAAVVIALAAVAELAFTGWLLLRGINIPPATSPKHSSSKWATVIFGGTR